MVLGLGTAQFGLDYGISNTAGRVSQIAVRSILDAAYHCGINILDTAAAYGDSERVLGETLTHRKDFNIITKLPALRTSSTVTQDNIRALYDTFMKSLKHLRTDHVYGLLLHSPDDILLTGGERLYDMLNSLKERGFVTKTGISVYSPRQIDTLFQEHHFDIVQMPVNVLDQRFIASGHCAKLASFHVEIHARSAFLQGLLLMNPEDVPDYFEPIGPILRRYHAFLADNSLTPIEGALGFLRTQKHIDVGIVGVTSVDELRENIKAFNAELPDDVDYSQFAVDDESMVNPVMWEVG